MPKLRVHNLSTSLDGYAAGPKQDTDHPLGVGGESLHEWVFATRYGRQMLGEEGGDTGAANDYLHRGDAGIGASIMGRNMFGPIRGAWPDDRWRGWWGDTPPYRHPVFVLTHHPRESFSMDGGTTFHFVTDGIEKALERAFDAANGLDVRLGGGPATIKQYLRAGLVDELHVAIAPVLLHGGERLFDYTGPDGIDPYGYRCVELVASGSVAHAWIVRAG
jgi:dihydrofolate reductase